MSGLPDELVEALHNAADAAPALPDDVVARLRDAFATTDAEGTAAA